MKKKSKLLRTFVVKNYFKDFCDKSVFFSEKYIFFFVFSTSLPLYLIITKFFFSLSHDLINCDILKKSGKKKNFRLF